MNSMVRELYFIKAVKNYAQRNVLSKIKKYIFTCYILILEKKTILYILYNSCDVYIQYACYMHIYHCILIYMYIFQSICLSTERERLGRQYKYIRNGLMVIFFFFT